MKMSSLTRVLLKPLTFFFTRVTRESFMKVMLLLLGLIIVLNLTITSLVSHQNSHNNTGLFWMWGQRSDVHRVSGTSSSIQQSIMPGTMDQEAISALTRENTLSVIKSSNAADSANEPLLDDYSARTNDYVKQSVAKSRSRNPNESHLSQNLKHIPKQTGSVIANVYPRPGKHKNRQNKGRNILDVSTMRKQKRYPSSNEVIPSDKIETYKKNLTALLQEIKLPTTTPEYDIVNPGASAEERGTPQLTHGKPCAAVPPDLNGPIDVSFASPTMSRLEAKFPDVVRGRWAPKDCAPLHRVAIIIPYRDRDEHLRVFLNHMHAFLQKQMMDYGIYIVEQAGKSRFNRAMLMNIGYTEAGKLYDNQCYIFHDVDLLPEDDRNLYSCPSQPRHMSVAVDTMSYKLPYPTIFGGVVAFKTEQFKDINGFSNCFFGWGGEDDDLYNRFRHKGYRLRRYPMRIARYRMISHLKEYPSPDRYTYLNTGSDRYSVDGLNSLRYRLLDVTRHKLFTRILVDINETEVIKNFQVTGMPPGLLELPANNNKTWFDEIVKDQDADADGAKTKTQNFYTIVKQSDILKIVENVKKETEREKRNNKRIMQLPEPQSRD